MAKSSTPKRPTRDEFELEELGSHLLEAKDDGDLRTLSVWGNSETIHGSRCWIHGLDWYM